MRRSVRVLVFGTTLLAACFGFGSVSIESTLKGRSINPQTIIAVFRLNKYETNGSGADRKTTVEPRPSDEQQLYLTFWGASLDPTQDLRFVDPDDRIAATQELALNGFLTARVDRAGFLEAGKDVIFDDAASDPIPSTSPTLGNNNWNISLAFAAAELESEELPETLTPFGSLRKATLKFTALGKKSGEPIEGTLTLEWKKETDPNNKDPDNALEGKLTLEFSTTVLPERIGTCNGFGGGAEGNAAFCNDFTE